MSQRYSCWGPCHGVAIGLELVKQPVGATAPRQVQKRLSTGKGDENGWDSVATGVRPEHFRTTAERFVHFQFAGATPCLAGVGTRDSITDHRASVDSVSCLSFGRLHHFRAVFPMPCGLPQLVSVWTGECRFRGGRSVSVSSLKNSASRRVHAGRPMAATATREARARR